MKRRYRPAMLLKRIVAFGIDMALWNVAYLTACRVLLGTDGVIPGERFLAYTVTFWSSLTLLNTFLLVSFNGQTPGKWAMGLRVVSLITGRIEFLDAASRACVVSLVYLAGMFSSLPTGQIVVSILILASVISVLFDEVSRRAIWDLGFGTMVIEAGAPERVGDTVPLTTTWRLDSSPQS
jgi:uncharacterized RDD family membrane protein YckC